MNTRTLLGWLSAQRSVQRVNPVDGYNAWSATYDNQPDNAVLALESRAFSELLSRVDIGGLHVIDVGCGTGRHWKEMLARQPARLVGLDGSPGMLEKLKARFPAAETCCLSGDRLESIRSDSCDVVTSTLALAHIPDAGRALQEWNRVLRPGGHILLTDFHAHAAQAGMQRSFHSSGMTFEIDQTPLTPDRVHELAVGAGLAVLWSRDLEIDESVRPLFAAAPEMFDKFRGLRLVFAMHLTKP